MTCGQSFVCTVNGSWVALSRPDQATKCTINHRFQKMRQIISKMSVALPKIFRHTVQDSKLTLIYFLHSLCGDGHAGRGPLSKVYCT